MHSIAHFILEHDENSRVLYVTSEEFTNELIEAIRSGELVVSDSLEQPVVETNVTVQYID